MVSYAQARAMDPNYNADESSYAWRIVYDHLESEHIDINGPHNATATQLGILAHPRLNAHLNNLTRFRIYDDDGELYFSGWFLGDSESEDAFSPLDDFGAPDSGATEIRYLRGEEWETL